MSFNLSRDYKYKERGFKIRKVLVNIYLYFCFVSSPIIYVIVNGFMTVQYIFV